MEITVELPEELTFKSEIIAESGLILQNKDDVIRVKEYVWSEAFWGKGSGVFYPEKVKWVTVEGDKDWLISCFEEAELIESARKHYF